MKKVYHPPTTNTLPMNPLLHPAKLMPRLALALALVMASTLVWCGQYEDATAAKARGDFPLAFASFSQMAVNGNANAQFELSLLYSAGKGVQANAKQALYWLKQAAAHGNVLAQSNLGVAFHRGLGVHQDNVKALVWLRIAADSGDSMAVTNRDVVARRMSAKDLERVKALEVECQQRMAEVLRLPQCM
jgi:TPR repeat protein